ncbi:hypothetical protein L6261_04195 [Candidatus Parcubacteria bacterium]|nr:hypothetical protein [Candidatus Parcubacteria bacterium]
MNNFTKKTIIFGILTVSFLGNPDFSVAFGGSGLFDGGAAFSSSFFGISGWEDFNTNISVGNISNVASTPVSNVSNVSTAPVGNVSNVASTPVSNVSNVASTPVSNVSNVSSTPVGNVSNVATTVVTKPPVKPTPEPVPPATSETPTPPVVTAPLSCSMTLSASSINENEIAVLSWTSKNVTKVVIDNSIGSVSLNGSLEVSPDSDTTYTGTFTGEGGSIKCKVTLDVEVLPPPPIPKDPACFMSINSSPINKGESAVLSWNSENVTKVVIDNSIGNVSLNGSLEVSPDSDTTYTGTFTGEGGSIVCKATLDVEVLPPPPIPKDPTCTMSVNPLSVNRGGSAVLSWDSSNVISVSFDNLSGSFGVSGSASVVPNNTTTYIGTFVGENKTISCQATLTVVVLPPPPPCTVNCGGGGEYPPNVFLSSFKGEIPNIESFIYLSQIPYTGIPEFVLLFFRTIFFGGLLTTFYKLKN